MTLVNGDSAAYWQGVEDGQLLFQKCAACGKVQFPPRHHCGSCWEGSLEWVESTGRGEVESFTIVRRTPVPAFRDKVPYVVASILLPEGPRMIAELVGDAAFGVSIGDKVTVDFTKAPDGTTLPVFRLAQ
jgi:uncharacterized OB-fold protein